MKCVVMFIMPKMLMIISTGIKIDETISLKSINCIYEVMAFC